MKKSVIAGAGVMALAAAAMPFAGVFADDLKNITDSISVSVASTCSFMNDAGSAVDANGTFTAENVVGGAEAELSNSGTHGFNVVCNNGKGYTVTAQATGLTSTNNGNAEKTIAYTAFSDYANTKDSDKKNGIWTAKVTNGNPDAVINASGALTILSSTETTDSKKFSVTYSVYVGTETPTGTYTGNVAYTLTPTPNN